MLQGEHDEVSVYQVHRNNFLLFSHLHPSPRLSSARAVDPSPTFGFVSVIDPKAQGEPTRPASAIEDHNF